jgi:hypothetical protein
VRWLLRVERLLARDAREQWQLERYRRAAEWVALRLPGAVMAQEKAREREAGAASGGDAKAAKERLSRLLKFGRLKR